MSIKKRKFDSIEKMLSFPKYITLDNDTLTLKNCIINFDFSLVNFISTISPQSIVCVSNEQKETEDTGIKKRPVCIVTTYTGLQVKVKVKKLRELFIC